MKIKGQIMLRATWSIITFLTANCRLCDVKLRRPRWSFKRQENFFPSQNRYELGRRTFWFWFFDKIGKGYIWSVIGSSKKGTIPSRSFFLVGKNPIDCFQEWIFFTSAFVLEIVMIHHKNKYPSETFLFDIHCFLFHVDDVIKSGPLVIFVRIRAYIQQKMTF